MKTATILCLLLLAGCAARGDHAVVLTHHDGEKQVICAAGENAAGQIQVDPVALLNAANGNAPMRRDMSTPGAQSATGSPPPCDCPDTASVCLCLDEHGCRARASR